MKTYKVLLASLCLSLLLFGQNNLKAQDNVIQYGTPFENVPDRQDAAIYQVNIRAFSEEGTFKGVQRRLDSIKALGVNVVYLMPIYPVGELKSAGGLGSPYAVRDYKTVNPAFGTLKDLRTLVEEAHERGIAVMLDWVANHTAWDHKWITAHKDWYRQDENGAIITPPGTNWKDVAQLDYSNEDLRNAMIDAMTYWVYAANIDGFRCDYADGPPFDFWKQAIEALKGIPGHELLLLAEGARKDHFKAGFDYIFGFNFFNTLTEEIFGENQSVTLLNEVNVEEYAGALVGAERVVRYISNHDVNIYEGTPLELFEGKQGSMAVFIVATYMKGVPMIYNGQEIGYPNRLAFFERTPIDWENTDEDMLRKYKAIIAFYKDSNAIRRGKLKSFSSDDVAVFTKEIGDEKVLVIVNLRNEPVTYTMPSPFTQTKWEDAFSGAGITINHQMPLPPFSYLVLKKL